MESYLGTIILWAGNFVPQYFLPCDGRSLPVNQYQALYSLLGNIYGGDATNFKLPDLRGCVPVGVNPSPLTNPIPISVYPLGGKGGNEKVTLTTNQLAAHNHNNTLTNNPSNVNIPISIPSVSGSDANAAKPISTTNLGKMSGTSMYSTNTPDSNLMPFTATGTVTPSVSITNAVAGANAPIDIRQPYLALNFIICVEGLYPSRP